MDKLPQIKMFRISKYSTLSDDLEIAVNEFVQSVSEDYDTIPTIGYNNDYIIVTYHAEVR